jgi:hypothetical protein
LTFSGPGFGRGEPGQGAGAFWPEGVLGLPGGSAARGFTKLSSWNISDISTLTSYFRAAFVVEIIGLFHSGRARGGGCKLGLPPSRGYGGQVAPDPRIFEAWTDAPNDGFTTRKGVSPDSGDTPLFCFAASSLTSVPAIPRRVVSQRCPFVFGRKKLCFHEGSSPSSLPVADVKDGSPARWNEVRPKSCCRQ